MKFRLRIVYIFVGILCIFGAVTYLAAWREDSTAVFISDKGSELTLVIDPGHGGADGGAVSYSGIKESEINLSVGLKLDHLSRFFGVKTAMTRKSEDITYPADKNTIRQKKVYDTVSRVDFIGKIPNAVLVSIHQNQFPSPSVRGMQMLFAPTDNSHELAQIMQNTMQMGQMSPNVRSIAPIGGDIYIMNNVSCPAVLIECGFISSPEDEKMLLEDNYQTRISAGILSSFLEYKNDLTTLRRIQ